MRTEPHATRSEWVKLDPSCPACQPVIAWRARHPKVPIERPGWVRTEAYRVKTAHRHTSVVRSR